ncbi:MAG: hypothetical protein E6G32_09900 [Actinobacteria bacterium]|nr:MAG: hypothetical protein E6G32_09900 [Actinomycetota bacterium]
MTLTALLALVTVLASPATVVKHYAPFEAGRLATGLTVRARASGYCWTGSATAYPRRDAWRCFKGRNVIVDPCFSASGTSVGPGFVICPDHAWDRGVLELGLTKALPREAANPGGPRRRAWAIVATNGLHCERLEGALPQIHGKPLTFACDRRGSMATEPSTRKSVWTTYYVRSQLSTRLRLLLITKAWW